MHFFNPAAPTNLLDWKLFAVEFTAANSITNFTFLNGAAANNFLTALDNVQLTALSEPPAAVPEPSSVAMMGSFVLLGMTRRVRRRKVQA